MNWQAGDQAMCIRGPEPIVAAMCRRRGIPMVSPPLVYTVEEVRCFTNRTGPFDEPYLNFAHMGRYFWRADLFRKFEPLAPEDIDLPERVPEPA